MGGAGGGGGGWAGEGRAAAGGAMDAGLGGLGGLGALLAAALAVLAVLPPVLGAARGAWLLRRARWAPGCLPVIGHGLSLAGGAPWDIMEGWLQGKKKGGVVARVLNQHMYLTADTGEIEQVRPRSQADPRHLLPSLLPSPPAPLPAPSAPPGWAPREYTHTDNPDKLSYRGPLPASRYSTTATSPSRRTWASHTSTFYPSSGRGS